MRISELRSGLHASICHDILRAHGQGPSAFPNIADSGSRSSKAIAWRVVKQMNCVPIEGHLSGQSAGALFERLLAEYLREAFTLLAHLRPGEWHYSVNADISGFAQYRHLADLVPMIDTVSELKSSLGLDYIVRPDVVISRSPVSDAKINRDTELVSTREPFAELTALRDREGAVPILHASISCKWTLRSDRSQNARTEALNLIRNRKGPLPHIVAVTAEPLPTRIASLALGTGDLDCVYHVAIYELRQAIADLDNEDQMDILNTMVDGHRLRDISDLPFDLAI